MNCSILIWNRNSKFGMIPTHDDRVSDREDWATVKGERKFRLKITVFESN